MIVPFRGPVGAPHLGAFFRNHALAAKAAGCEVGVICPELRSLTTLARGKLSRNAFRVRCLDDAGVETWKLGGWRVPLMPELNARIWHSMALRLAHHYTRVRGVPDLIHAHWGLHAGFAARTIAADLDIPYVVHEHFTGYQRNVLSGREVRKIERVFRDAAAVATVSRSLRDQISVLVEGKEIIVIPNVVIADEFPFRERSLSSNTNRQYAFLTVCHLEPQKGVDVLLRAFASRFRGRNVALAIGGDGSERAKLQAMTHELGLVGQVTFLGAMLPSEVARAMRNSDAFVLPSRHETFGVVLIEAMSSGLPVVATCSGGPEDFVDASVGYLVPPEDVFSLGSVMEEVWLAREYWRKQSRYISEKVKYRFSPEEIGKHLITMYRRALDKVPTA